MCERVSVCAYVSERDRERKLEVTSVAGKLLARGERIEAIETKAEDLRSKTNTFDKKTKEVVCAMCVYNIKMTICLIITIIVRTGSSSCNCKQWQREWSQWKQKLVVAVCRRT